MNKPLLLFFFSLFLACENSNVKNEVQLYNGINFRLAEGEKVLEVATEQKNLYQSHLDKLEGRIPLFKIISTQDYRIYIGIPFELTFKELKADLNALCRNSHSDQSFFSCKSKQQEQQFSHALIRKGENRFYLQIHYPKLDTSESAKLINSISQRFNEDD